MMGVRGLWDWTLLEMFGCVLSFCLHSCVCVAAQVWVSLPVKPDEGFTVSFRRRVLCAVQLERGCLSSRVVVALGTVLVMGRLQL